MHNDNRVDFKSTSQKSEKFQSNELIGGSYPAFKARLTVSFLADAASVFSLKSPNESLPHKEVHFFPFVQLPFTCLQLQPCVRRDFSKVSVQRALPREGTDAFKTMQVSEGHTFWIQGNNLFRKSLPVETQALETHFHSQKQCSQRKKEKAPTKLQFHIVCNMLISVLFKPPTLYRIARVLSCVRIVCAILCSITEGLLARTDQEEEHP